MAVTIIAATLSALARLIDAPTSLEFDVAAHLPRCIAMRPNDATHACGATDRYPVQR
jgi:hypothetical protein